MAYFLTDDNSTKGRDPNVNIINGNHKENMLDTLNLH